MKKLIIATLAFLPLLSIGQVDRSIIPSSGAAPLINIKDSEIFKTDNGITVILSENHKIPSVSFQLSLGADPILEGPKAGVSNVMGDLVMSGTAKLTKDELDNQIDYIGAYLSASSGGMYLSVMTRFRDKGLALMSDVLQNASFPESEFDRIVKQFESGLKSAKSEPSQMANNANAKVNYDAMHPFSETMTEESLKSIKLEDVKQLYKLIYVPEGSYLVIVGDITKEEAKAAVDKYFTSWIGGKAYKGASLYSKPASGSQVAFVSKTGAVQSVINVNIPMDVAPGDPDQIGLTVLNQVFGGSGFGTRLMQNLREDKAFTYGCYARQNIDEHGSLLTISGNFRNDVTDSAITEILYEIQKITTELAGEEELETTKAAMAGSFARSLESPQTIARFARNIEKYGLDKDYYKNYLKTLAAVNKDDVLRLAKKYMSAENVNIVVVGNDEVAAKLKAFDSDGKILKLDAFGNAVKEKKTADISADQLIENYVYATTQTTSMKKAIKKLKKIKSYSRTTELSAAQIPFPLKMSEVWIKPNTEGSKLEGQGMVLQKSYFDGNAGGTTSMQTGSKALTEEEVTAQKKSFGIIPEMNYATSGMKYEMVGIEVVEDKDMYVLSSTDGKKTQLDYFDKVTYLKMKSIITNTEDGEVRSAEYDFGNYSMQGGLMSYGTISMAIGPMTLEGKVKSFEVNGKIELNTFK
ncbi:MAG: pitrilysin family protein [Flavobacteriales bacterium]